MTKSELDQIGQSLLSQYNINTIAQQAIDAAARHGLTLTGTEIKDIPVRVTMQYADGRWDDQVDIINPLSEYSNIAFSKLYRIYKDAPYYYEDVTLFRIAFCFDDGEEEIAAIECSLLAPWRMCEVLVEKGLAQTTAEFRPDENGIIDTVQTVTRNTLYVSLCSLACGLTLGTPTLAKSCMITIILYCSVLMKSN